MTEEKYKEIQKKIVKAVENGSPTGMAKNIQEIAFDYAEMINEVVVPNESIVCPDRSCCTWVHTRYSSGSFG